MERKVNKLDSIQVLRGIAVLLVIAFHFRVYLNGVYAQKDLGDIMFRIGEVGVDIFFVISGFIITYSSINKDRNKPLEFAIKRFFRLYPVYFIVLTLVISLNYETIYTISQIIKSYMLIPIDYNFIGPWSGYSIIIPAWTLTYEIWFYTVFCVSLCISHKYRTIIASSILITICMLSQVYFHGNVFLNPIAQPPFGDGIIRNLVFVSNPISYDFILGMVVAEAYINVPFDFLDKMPVIQFLNITALFALLLLCLGLKTGPGIVAWGGYSFMIVAPLVLISKCRNVYCNKALTYVGEISYSLYINHMVVYTLAVVYLKPYGILDSKGFGVFLALVCATFIVSIISYNFIEKPFVAIGHAIARKIQNKPYILPVKIEPISKF
ncbi:MULTISPECIES: acyltransferase [unclassified Escherichia]|uniref:acyltransferase family protein n=1 Tax=unclassified Escherichia TaxID=2608889 RepID=UPI00102949EE|nr:MULTISPECIES: acyltransferase [unclassified Escherichia]RZM86182.1 acyltransferase [Escherichia sp. E1V33]TBR66495.1 acyltransferase [Escherichia sp. E1S7]